MFRDGHYLEVIKASENCLATAIITVQERTVEIKNRKVSTNKWLDVEDWAAVYKVLERAILKDRGRKDFKKSPVRKFTRRLEVSYTFEEAECGGDVSSLPTIRASVSKARRKSDKADKNSKNDNNKESPDNNDVQSVINNKRSSRVLENQDWSEKNRKYRPGGFENGGKLEEYVPDGPPAAKRHCSTGLKYVPSRKSALERIVQKTSNEYEPTLPDNKHLENFVRYVPSSVTGSRQFEAYEPCPVGLPEPAQEYVPNSKATVEEYQPDFTSDRMKFDDSYVPSSVRVVNENIVKRSERPGRSPQETSGVIRSHQESSGDLRMNFDDSYVPSSVRVVNENIVKRSERPGRSPQETSGVIRSHQESSGDLRMKFDDSYVPSSVRVVNENIVKRSERPGRSPQESSGVLRSHQETSGVLRSHQETSGVLRSSQEISGVIRSHQERPQRRTSRKEQKEARAKRKGLSSS